MIVCGWAGSNMRISQGLETWVVELFMVEFLNILLTFCYVYSSILCCYLKKMIKEFIWRLTDWAPLTGRICSLLTPKRVMMRCATFNSCIQFIQFKLVGRPMQSGRCTQSYSAVQYSQGFQRYNAFNRAASTFGHTTQSTVHSSKCAL